MTDSANGPGSGPGMGPGGGRVDYAVFCGVDVGKSAHHACALDPAGQRLHDKALPNDEAALRRVFTDLGARGRVLVVVDQPASIGALAIAVARAMGIDVAYLPGLAMRRLADLHPGESKTDARDAFVIADAARSMPHALRRVSVDEETVTELRVLAGYDADLVESGVRLSNQLRDSLLHVHPALERVLGPRLDRPGVLDLLAAAPTPQALRELGVDGIAGLLRPRSPRMARLLPEPIIAALDAQTVVIPGTGAFARVIAGVAAQLRDVRIERDALAADLEQRLAAHPLAAVLSSMPGVGLRTTLTMLTVVGDASGFPSAGHLAAYAGLAPVTRRSGTSVRSQSRSKRGHHGLKTALFLSAFASLADPASRAYYDRKRAEGKRHNSALICLTRRRLDVLFAMLRSGQPYRPPVGDDPKRAAAAA